MVGSRNNSDASSLSSVSSKELEGVDCDGRMGLDGGSASGGGGGMVRTSAIAKLDNFLSCREDNKFPSDAEDEQRKERQEGKGRGRGEEMDYRLLDLLKSSVGRGRRGGGHAPPANRRFPTQPMYLTKESFQGRGKPVIGTSSPPVPLKGFKSATVTRLNQAFGDTVPRKRRPRLEPSLRVCRDFVTDVLSKKHKDWVWPLCKVDKTNPAAFKDPIYLNDIKTKLCDRDYTNADDFAADIRKLINNFIGAYHSSTQFHISARRLQGMFEEEFKKAKQAGENIRSGWVGSTDEVRNILPNSLGEMSGVNQRSSKGLSGGMGTTPSSNFSMSSPRFEEASSFESLARGWCLSKIKAASTATKLRRPSCGSSGTESGDEMKKQQNSGVAVLDGKRRSIVGPSSGQVQGEGSPSLSESWSDVMGKGRVEDDSRLRKRVTDGDGGQVGKKLRTDQANDEGPVTEPDENGCDTSGVDLSIVKMENEEEEEEEEENVEVEDADQVNKTDKACETESNKRFASKWIMDGIMRFTGQETDDTVSCEIKNMIGKGQDVVLDLDLLESLDAQKLVTIGNHMLRNLVGIRANDDGPSTTCSVSNNVLKAAIDVIAESQTEMFKMQKEISTLKLTSLTFLQTIQKMEENSLELLNKLHARKCTIQSFISYN